MYSYIKSDCKTISIAFDNNKGNLLDLEKEFDIISSDGSVLKMLEEKIKNESYNAKKWNRFLKYIQKSVSTLGIFVYN